MITHIKNELQLQDELYIRAKITPNAKKTEIIEKMPDETYKMKVAAVAQKGKANNEIVAFLSNGLEIPKKNITIVSGQKSPLKLIKLSYK